VSQASSECEYVVSPPVQFIGQNGRLRDHQRDVAEWLHLVGIRADFVDHDCRRLGGKRHRHGQACRGGSHELNATNGIGNRGRAHRVRFAIGRDACRANWIPHRRQVAERLLVDSGSAIPTIV
jgi:hypothetical protein